MSVVAGGAYQIKAGADVVEAGQHGGDVGLQRQIIQRQDQHRHHSNGAVGRHVGVDPLDGLLIHRGPVHLNKVHAAGVEHLPNPGVEALAQKQQPGTLDAAPRTARAGAYDHQHHQDGPGKLGPQVKVRRGKARGGHDAGHGKGRVVKGAPDAAVEGINVGSDNGDGAKEDGQIHPQLLIEKSLLEPADEHQKIDAEVHPEKGHKDGTHRLQIGRVARHGVILDAETAGTRRAEGGAEAVEKGHPSRQQKHNAQHRQGDIE